MPERWRSNGNARRWHEAAGEKQVEMRHTLARRMMVYPQAQRGFFDTWSLEQPTSLVLDCTLAEFPAPDAHAPQITVGIIDSHRLSREALAQILAKACGETTIPAFSDVAEFLAGPSSEVAVLIYRAHGSESIASIDEELDRLSLARSGILVIILSDSSEPLSLECARQALQRGVRCVLSARNTALPVILALLPLVRAGSFVTSLNMMPTHDRPATQPSSAALTRRQAAVFEGLSRGKDNQSIAAEMNISETAVGSHVRHIMRALGAITRAEAVQLARARLHSCSDEKGADATNRKCVQA